MMLSNNIFFAGSIVVEFEITSGAGVSTAAAVSTLQALVHQDSLNLTSAEGTQLTVDTSSFSYWEASQVESKC